MLFAWLGRLRDDVETIPQDVQQQTNEFLQQPYLPIQMVGPLCNDHGGRAGMLMIFEADNRSSAEALVANSPFLRAGLYEEHELFEYRNEVG
jgi:uncharacterized protein YciI